MYVSAGFSGFWEVWEGSGGFGKVWEDFGRFWADPKKNAVFWGGSSLAMKPCPFMGRFFSAKARCPVSYNLGSRLDPRHLRELKEKDVDCEQQAPAKMARAKMAAAHVFFFGRL